MLRVKELRRAHELTQVELAQKLNITQTAVSQWEKGRTMPDISQLTQMSKIFGVSINYILGEIDDPQSHEEIEAVETDDDLRFEDLRYAFYDGMPEDLSDEEKEQIVAFARFMREERKKKG